MKLPHLSRPRPVLTSAGITGGVQGVVLVLTFLGYNQAAAHLASSTATITSVALGVLTVGGNLLHGLHAQKQATPLSSPQDHDGTPLVRADVLSAALAAAPDLSTPTPGPVGVGDMPAQTPASPGPAQ